MLNHFQSLVDDSASKKKLLCGFVKRAAEKQHQQHGPQQQQHQQGQQQQQGLLSQQQQQSQQQQSQQQGQQSQQQQLPAEKQHGHLQQDQKTQQIPQQQTPQQMPQQQVDVWVVNDDSDEEQTGQQQHEQQQQQQQRYGGSRTGNEGSGSGNGVKGDRGHGSSKDGGLSGSVGEVCSLLAGAITVEEAELLLSPAAAKGDVSTALNLYYDGRLSRLKQQQQQQQQQRQQGPLTQRGKLQQSQPQGKGKQQQQQQQQQKGKRKQTSLQGGSATKKGSKGGGADQQRTIASFFMQRQPQSQAQTTQSPMQQVPLVMDLRTPSPERLSAPQQPNPSPQPAPQTPVLCRQGVQQQQQQQQGEEGTVCVHQQQQPLQKEQQEKHGNEPKVFSEGRAQMHEPSAPPPSSTNASPISPFFQSRQGKPPSGMSQNKQQQQQQAQQQSQVQRHAEGLKGQLPGRKQISAGPLFHKDAVLLSVLKYDPVRSCSKTKNL